MAPARIEPPATVSEVALNLPAIQEKSSKLNSPVDIGKYRLLDQVFRHRAADPCQVPLLAFPKHNHADFEFFTGRQLDRFTDSAAWIHQGQGLSSAESNVVGILGTTDIDWVITLFALSRAGNTVLILSPRLSAEAITKLTQETQCHHIIYRDSSTLSGIVKEVEDLSRDMKTHPMLTRELYDDPSQVVAPFTGRVQDVSAESNKTCLIMHSAGSTGLPKAMGVTHSRFTTLCPLGDGNEDLMTLPLSHAFGITGKTAAFTVPCNFFKADIALCSPYTSRENAILHRVQSSDRMNSCPCSHVPPQDGFLLEPEPPLNL